CATRRKQARSRAIRAGEGSIQGSKNERRTTAGTAYRALQALLLQAGSRQGLPVVPLRAQRQPAVLRRLAQGDGLRAAALRGHRAGSRGAVVRLQAHRGGSVLRWI